MATQNNPIFYAHHTQPPSSAFGLNLNPHNNSHENSTTKQFAIEPMFQKLLTPSDVGKLNRLVIPKHHAEKYFPLRGGGDAAHQQKGLLLSFEDESGKLWRFRYSHWNSSQSYVFTKGWSRYVKEKRLDAGDLVFFKRHGLDCERMFIGWTRRSASAVPFNDGMAAAVTPAINARSHSPSHHLPICIPLPNQPDCIYAGDVYENVVNYQRGEVTTTRLPLFGVNLECPDDSNNLYRQDTVTTDCYGQKVEDDYN